MRIVVLAFFMLVGTASATSTVSAQTQPEKREITSVPLQAPPKELLPSRVAGSGFDVLNLEAQRAWYETYLGFRVLRYYVRSAKRMSM